MKQILMRKNYLITRADHKPPENEMVVNLTGKCVTVGASSYLFFPIMYIISFIIFILLIYKFYIK